MPAGAPCATTHVAINSLASYDVPRRALLEQLQQQGVPMTQVHVFLGDSSDSAADDRYVDQVSGAWHYRVRHNSVDFTAMVHIVEHPRLFPSVRQWFYLHDTVSVGSYFWSNATRWCNDGLPACALPLTRYLPTSSMGLYDATFLNTHARNVTALKNKRGATGLRWKLRGVGWEDKLFKVCDAVSPDAPIRRFTRQCYNATLRRRTCICASVDIGAEPRRVYGAGSTPRQAWNYPCANISKFKANWCALRANSFLLFPVCKRSCAYASCALMRLIRHLSPPLI